MTTPRSPEKDADGGWSYMQVREFAERFARSHKAAWHAYVADVREALIDSAVLLVVLGQDRVSVPVREIVSLRSRLGRCLLDRHDMQNEMSE